jgi:hypothetical protein
MEVAQMTNEEIMQMEEAKLVAEQEARAVVNEERKDGETNEEVLKELFNTTYKRVLAQELGVEEQ